MMKVERPPMMMMVVVLLCTLFQGSYSGANYPMIRNKTLLDTSSVVFPLTGNVYPKSAYFATVNVGNPGEPFELHVNPGSDMTWVPCYEPCDDCDEPVGHLYKPREDNIVKCEDPICAAVQGEERICENPTDRCEYVVFYSDYSSSEGYLVRDIFHLPDKDNVVTPVTLVFGCGYRQTGEFKGEGSLGLGKGPANFLSQLHSMSQIKQVFGHCLAGEGGGFLFLGDDLVPSSGVSWTPIIPNDDDEYLSGPANLLVDGSLTPAMDLYLEFDGGSPFSYFKQPAFQSTIDMIHQALSETPLISAQPEDKLAKCWRFHAKPIESFHEINDYFKQSTLKFQTEPNAELDLPPQAYLLLIDGKVCLGILDGDNERINYHLIGAISMQDKLVIYDNRYDRIGWTSYNCKRRPMD